MYRLPRRRPFESPLQLQLQVLACAVPPLIAYSLTPSATLFNQLAALGLWGITLMGLAMTQPRGRCGPAVWALLILMISPWMSWIAEGHSLSLALGATVWMIAALLLLAAAQGLGGVTRQRWFAAFCWGLLVAGVLSVLVSVIQV